MITIILDFSQCDYERTTKISRFVDKLRTNYTFGSAERNFKLIGIRFLNPTENKLLHKDVILHVLLIGLFAAGLTTQWTVVKQHA